MRPLELSSFPLTGIQLIEASAGTGKTYTLANLYLRYLLENQCLVEQILVVTFTEAATKELKGRVRSGIVELLSLFEWAVEEYPDIVRGDDLSRDAIDALSPDPLMVHLLIRSESLEQDLLRLRVAERQIDKAEIHTIHGFCQKVIRENALLLKLSSKQLLQENPENLRQQVVEDLWRTHLLKLPEDAFRLITESWKEPAALLSELKPLLSRHPVKLYPEVSNTSMPLEAWIEEFESSQHWFQELIQVTLEEADAAIESLAQSDVSRVNNKITWVENARQWALDGGQQKAFKKLSLEKLRASHLVNELKAKGTKLADHHYFSWLDRHLESIPEDPKPKFIPVFLKLFTEAYAQLKRAQGLLDFDDLVMQLYEALKPNADPQLQAQLVSLLRRQYAIALIDEFQDTDRHQYQIFDRIFGTACAPESPSLVLIGDPKQAIYGFRGGDMSTYLKAKRAVQQHEQGEQFGMEYNWRSSPAMVRAVNGIFEFHDNPFGHTEIPFLSVKAAKESPDEPWGAPLQVTQLLVDQEAGITKAELSWSLAQQCVIDISNLLDRKDQLGLRSSDIAILVRDRSEAERVRDRLAACGIKACFDDRTSIFTTEEARVLLRLLAAVEDPGNDFLMRQCLAEPLLQISDEVIQRLDQDSSAYLRMLGIFQGLHETWGQHGVRAMAQKALQVLGTLRAWGALGQIESMWERSASNILQLLDLLQDQSRVARTPRALLDWLQRQIALGTTEGAYEMRLESDDDLIRIVTIHKSKGLEYKVVHLPFVFSGKGSNGTWFYDDNDELCVSFAPTQEHKALADKERLAEDMRLLYVALTRSRFKCYVGTAAYVAKGAQSLSTRATAFGYLIGGDSNLKADQELTERLRLFTNEAGAEYVELHLNTLAQVDSAYEALPIRESELQLDSANLSRRMMIKPNESNWKVHSFTGLMHEHEALATPSHQQREALAPANPNNIDILHFPRGSQAGTFLHSLFENIRLEDASLHHKLSVQYESLEAYVSDLLSRQRLVPENLISRWADYLASWVSKVLNTHIIDGLCLSKLSEHDYRVEADFHFSVHALQARQFNILLKSATATNTANTKDPNKSDLLFSQFEGHLKGAIDLMFRHENRYYILDYKSNHLGYSASNYDRDAMQMAIQDHRYDVQYLIYTVALHRLLKQRLGDAYDYDLHMGGVIYLFLRGMRFENAASSTHKDGQAISSPGVFVERPSKELILALDALMSEEVA